MCVVQVGEQIPDIELPATGDQQIKLSQFRGQRLVLYFYPRANTSGCAQEGRDFRDNIEEFSALNTVILGASRDGVKAQGNFKNKQEFPFDLLADKEEALCDLFDIIKIKMMYGKQGRGIERSTFLIDEKGILRRQWRKVKVKGHVDEVLQAVRELAC